MKQARLAVFSALWGGVLLGLILGGFRGHTQESGGAFNLPEGVYIKLTKEFYEALKAEGDPGIKTYSNDPSREYLRQIAVASRFSVEAHLQILKNQEQIIKLLHSGKENRVK